MSIDPVWFTVLADTLINLGAGWFAIAITVTFTTSKRPINRWLLTINTTAGILSLILAFYLRKYSLS